MSDLAEMEMQRIPVYEAARAINECPENVGGYYRLNGDVLYSHARKEYWFGIHVGTIGSPPAYVGWAHYFPEYKDWDARMGSPDPEPALGLRTVDAGEIDFIRAGVGEMM